MYVLTLFINTASAEGIIALVNTEQTIAYVPCTPKTTEGEITKYIEELLQKTGHTYANLTQAICITGPGGFTSLRIGVTIINTLHVVCNIPVAGIHLAELYRFRLNGSNTLWLHSTKKDLVFVQGFGTLATKYPKPQCLNIEEVKNDCAHANITGELMADHTAILSIKPTQWAGLAEVTEALPQIVANTTASNNIVTPWYGRGW